MAQRSDDWDIELRLEGLRLFWRDDLCPDTVMVDICLQENGRSGGSSGGGKRDGVINCYPSALRSNNTAPVTSLTQLKRSILKTNCQRQHGVTSNF